MAHKDAATVNARISGVVEMLLTGRRQGPEDLAGALKCSRSTAYNKLNGNTEKGWTAEDLDALSLYFGLPVERFFAGPDALISSISRESEREISHSAIQPSLWDSLDFVSEPDFATAAA